MENHLPISYSCGSDASAGGVRSGWGGARNRSDRVSHYLKLEQAIELRDASLFAFQQGLWLNRFLSIHYRKLGVPDCDAVKVTGIFLRLAREWLNSRGQKFAYAWVREMDKKGGSHIHILFHVPPAIVHEFVRKQLGWLRKATGLAYKSKVILTRRVGYYLHAATANPSHYRKNLHKVLRYLSKGVPAEAAKILHLNRTDRMAPLIGKRSGTSQNIGRKARQQFFRELALEKVKEGIGRGVFSAPQLTLVPGAISWERQFQVHLQPRSVAEGLLVQRGLTTPLCFQLPLGSGGTVRFCRPFVACQAGTAKRSNVWFGKLPRTTRYIRFRSNLARYGHSNKLLFGMPRSAGGKGKRQPMNAILKFHTGSFLVHIHRPLLQQYITGPPDQRQNWCRAKPSALP